MGAEYEPKVIQDKAEHFHARRGGHPRKASVVRRFAIVFVVLTLPVALGCKKDPVTDSTAGSTAASARSFPRVAAKPAGLGTTREAFLPAWNACAAGFGQNAGKLNIESLPEGDAWVATFAPGLSLSGTFAGTTLLHLVLSKGGGDMGAMILGRLAFSCIVKVTSPGTDETGLIADLGMVTGTSTTTVRGATTFSFSQESGGPELISAFATGSARPTPPPTGKP